MRIVVPVFQGSISPAFDWCREIWITEIDAQGNEVSRENLSIDDSSPLTRLRILSESHTEILLCGGISDDLLRLIESQGIQVVPWITGNADEVLRAFVNHEVFQSQFKVPGRCCRKGRHRGRKRENRGHRRVTGRSGRKNT